MFNPLHWAVATSILLILIKSPAAASDQPIIIGFDHDSPPFSYNSEDGVADGIYPALTREIFSRIGHPVMLRAYPWKRVLAGIESGQSAAGGIYITTERQRKYRFSSAIFQDRILLFIPRDRNLALTGITDLKGLRLGVIKGWSYGDRFDRLRREGQFEAQEARNDATNLRKLQAGRLDAFLAVEVAGLALINSKPLEIPVRAFPHPVTVNSVHIAFNRSDQHQELVPALNDAIADMLAEDSFDRILDEKIDPRYRGEVINLMQ